MIISYFTTAFRNFKRNQVHSSINIVGLSIGLMASVLAIMFVLDEWSFDTFHSKKERLYRLNKITTESDGSTSLTAESSGLMGPTMINEFPEVEKVVRYQPWYNTIVLSYNDRHVEMKEMEAVFVDSTFFEVFDFSLVQGDPAYVLTRPLTIVLTPDIAIALFGMEDPIGKSVKGMNDLEFEVTGIAEESPRNSHIQYKALLSWTTTVPQVGPLNFEFLNNWIAQALTTYVLLKPGANEEALQNKFPKFMQDHMPTRVDKYQLYLQPFQEVYLNSYTLRSHRMAKLGNQQYVYVFTIIAGFILFIACVNYINISTSKSMRRAREVGMRKSLGATRVQLINQFLGESLFITLLSAAMAVLLVYLAVPFFNDLAGKSLPMALLLDTRVLLGVVVLMVFVSLMAGLYPAFILSAFRPSEVLRASARSRLTGNLPRHILITFQFILSIAMIAGTLGVYQQIRYVFSKDLGFDKEHVLVLELTNSIMTKGETFTNEVSTHPAVVSTSLGRTALGRGSSSTFIVPEGFPPDQVEIRMFPADGNFKETYDLEMAMGRFFNPMLATDSNALVINEALMKQLQWENPMQKTIKFREEGEAYAIIGVLKDFNYGALYQNVEPLVMWMQRENMRNLSIRFNGDPTELLAFLETKWKAFEDRYPFRYYFVDDAFAKAYQADVKLFETVISFAGLSTLIACLGLYGLVSFTVEQRTKEFGIRKVLGATVASLNYLVTRKFIVMVGVAGLVAVPVMIPLLHAWLKKFAFRIEIGPGIFFTAVLITLGVTVLAVSVQAVKAAMRNPANSLRHE